MRWHSGDDDKNDGSTVFLFTRSWTLGVAVRDLLCMPACHKRKRSQQREKSVLMNSSTLSCFKSSSTFSILSTFVGGKFGWLCRSRWSVRTLPTSCVFGARFGNFRNRTRPSTNKEEGNPDCCGKVRNGNRHTRTIVVNQGNPDKAECVYQHSRDWETERRTNGSRSGGRYQTWRKVRLLNCELKGLNKTKQNKRLRSPRDRSVCKSWFAGSSVNSSVWPSTNAVDGEFGRHAA